jgi:acetate kinase
MKILVLNSGSSSQKACLYEIGEPLPDDPSVCLWEGKLEWNGRATTVKPADGNIERDDASVSSRKKALEHLLGTLCNNNGAGGASVSGIDVVGHRIVHGGPQFEQPVLVTREVKAAIAGTAAFAPLHTEAALEGLEVIEALLGPVPQIAVFDTGYHQNMPIAAAVYPGPYEWLERGIRRYGFHGINHQYCAGRAARLLGRDVKSLKVVTCHLGNGCSLAATDGGRSIDTTMGFTPLDGLMMGTRSGSVDPGVLTYLMRHDHLQGQDIDNVLNKNSGLLGVSGLSSDMREILVAINQGHPRARLAFDVYVHRLRSGIGAMVAVLGGIDALVFTAGAGENSPELRAAACEPLGFLGLKLDRKANAQPSLDQDIATGESQVRVLVIRAQEDWAIARECWKLARVLADWSDTAEPAGTFRS